MFRTFHSGVFKEVAMFAPVIVIPFVPRSFSLVQLTYSTDETKIAAK